MVGIDPTAAHHDGESPVGESFFSPVGINANASGYTQIHADTIEGATSAEGRNFICVFSVHLLAFA